MNTQDTTQSTLQARTGIGRVGCPAGQEANSELFHFWVPSDSLVEKTQLVTCHSEIAGEKLAFYAIINEVYRSSRKRSMGQEFDEADGDLDYAPPFQSEGCTWAEAAILRTNPPFFTPPRERSEVLLARAQDADMAYWKDDIREDQALPVGLVKNGGRSTLGAGYIDLDYLLGLNGGHLNVNGSAGRGTKSSFLLFINWLLIDKARREAKARLSDDNRLKIVPIVLNVKAKDLFFIDRPNKHFTAEHERAWNELGVENPAPFEKVEFFAPQQPGSSLAVAIQGRGNEVKPYSWSLQDVIKRGLLIYLFAESDAGDANFAALAYDITEKLTKETFNNDGTVRRELDTHVLGTNPPTFQGLLNWLRDECQKPVFLNGHSAGTVKKFYRRLFLILSEGDGVLRRRDENSHPLEVVRFDNSGPIVIDLSALENSLELQRFVVATIFRQLADARNGTSSVKNLKYIVTLDELNRFAPRGSHDPITQLIERVAAEMRSQGIILLGAQQQASLVSQRVIENAAIRALGKSGSLEMTQPIWRFLSDSARRKAENLQKDEKLIVQDNFREPMHVRVPFPCWALNREESQVAHSAVQSTLNGQNGHASYTLSAEETESIFED
jgi:hypothetical protein